MRQKLLGDATLSTEIGNFSELTGINDHLQSFLNPIYESP